MKSIILPLSILTLVALVGYQLFLQRHAHQEVQQLTLQLQHRLDTLEQIASRYERIHQHYQKLHIQLLRSHHRAHRAQDELTRLSLDHQQEVSALQSELQALLRTYHTEGYALPSHSIDSLLFTP